MKKKQIKKVFNNEHGGSLLEFALIMPLLFIILFGIIEFGILLYDKAMITNASREGARAGIVFSDPRTSDEEIIEVVRDYCANYLISFDESSTLIIPPPERSGNSAGSSLTVRVTYPFRFLVLSNLISLLGGDIESLLTLNAVTVMRLE